MRKINRRSFFKKAFALGVGLAGTPAPVDAQPDEPLSPDRVGVLVDTTVCIGCRNCEWACKKAHAIATPPIESYEDRSVFKKMRRPDPLALTVVNSYENPRNSAAPYGVKIQCMHCDHPACVSACIVGALSKERDGAVIWDTKKCIGCRYCLIACPFQVPAFEYGNALYPRITKCDFCLQRRREGNLPGCVQACPVEALTFGRREELLRVGQRRVKASPDRYIDHIYGEHEVGGTSWMYLAGREFSQLQFPALGDRPAPGVSESIQHGIFAYFVPPVSLYGLLGLLMWTSKNGGKEGESE